MKCFVVDDEPLARKGIVEYISDTDFLEFVGDSAEPEDALPKLISGEVDLLFLDIHLVNKSGLDFLRTYHPKQHVILTTAYPQYALEAFGLHVSDYLLKPIAYERFLDAVTVLNEASDNDEPVNKDFLFFKSEGGFFKVRFKELLFAESMQNYIRLHVGDKRLIIHMTMQRLLELLPQSRFLRVHKSYLVNRQHVDSLQGNEVYLSNERKVPVSRRLKEEIKHELLNGKYRE